jgi:hypothetical protein
MLVFSVDVGQLSRFRLYAVALRLAPCHQPEILAQFWRILPRLKATADEPAGQFLSLGVEASRAPELNPPPWSSCRPQLALRMMSNCSSGNEPQFGALRYGFPAAIAQRSTRRIPLDEDFDVVGENHRHDEAAVAVDVSAQDGGEPVPSRVLFRNGTHFRPSLTCP